MAIPFFILTFSFFSCKNTFDKETISEKTEDENSLDVVDAEIPIIEYNHGLVFIYQNTPVNISFTSKVIQGTLSYQWYKTTDLNNFNGIIIQGANSNCLTVQEITHDEFFYCIITNRIDDNGDGGIKEQSRKTKVFTLGISTLPVINITTINEEVPSYDIPFYPEGVWGQTIINAKKVPGKMVIKCNGECIYDSGDYENKVSGITIKVRGNGSVYCPKIPYKIKLQEKSDLLYWARSQQDSINHSDKNWVLIDGSNMKTQIGLKVSDLIGFEWVPACAYVDVILNGKYLGVYLLIESIERADYRINVKKKGFIIEHDLYWYTENLYFQTPDYYSYYLRYTFKYPDPDDEISLNDNNFTYIKTYVCNAYEAILNGNYDEYLDINSFSSWVLAHDILGTSDTLGSNRFISKYDQGNSKLKMETPWDFDSIMEIDNAFSPIHNAESFYYPFLFESNNKEFLNCYKTKWNSVKESLFMDLMNYLSSFETENADRIDNSRKLNSLAYDGNGEYISVSDEVESINDYFTNRKLFLTEKIEELE